MRYVALVAMLTALLTGCGGKEAGSTSEFQGFWLQTAYGYKGDPQLTAVQTSNSILVSIGSKFQEFNPADGNCIAPQFSIEIGRLKANCSSTSLKDYGISLNQGSTTDMKIELVDGTAVEIRYYSKISEEQFKQILQQRGVFLQ